MAFQIKDDLFDYGTEEVGKPLGIDIKEQKMTLPLIYSLQNASHSTKRKIIRTVKSKGDHSKKVNEVVGFVRESGGIEYAQKVMNQYYQEAKQILETFEPSVYRDSLSQLVTYTIERSK